MMQTRSRATKRKRTTLVASSDEEENDDTSDFAENDGQVKSWHFLYNT